MNNIQSILKEIEEAQFLYCSDGPPPSGSFVHRFDSLVDLDQLEDASSSTTTTAFTSEKLKELEHGFKVATFSKDAEVKELITPTNGQYIVALLDDLWASVVFCQRVNAPFSVNQLSALTGCLLQSIVIYSTTPDRSFHTQLMNRVIKPAMFLLHHMATMKPENDCSFSLIGLQFWKASESIMKTEKEFDGELKPRSLWVAALLLVFRLILADVPSMKEVPISNLGVWFQSMNAKDKSKENVWPRLLECLKLHGVQTVLIQNNFQDVVAWANEDSKAVTFQSIANKLQTLFPMEAVRSHVLQSLSSQKQVRHSLCLF
jgi:hypothetical protein